MPELCEGWNLTDVANLVDALVMAEAIIGFAWKALDHEIISGLTIDPHGKLADIRTVIAAAKGMTVPPECICGSCFCGSTDEHGGTSDDA